MFRQRSSIALFFLLFLAFDALGLLFLSSPSRAVGAPLSAPTATPRPRIAAPTPTPVRRRAAPSANEFRVCNSNGTYSQTIQSAVDAAQSGDVIKVAGGVYVEAKPSLGANLFISKTLYIYGGYNCSDWTTQNPTLNVSRIQPSTSAISVVYIQGQFGNTTVVAPTFDGFTITGGGGGDHGGGLRIVDSNALINNNVITGNLAYLLGGGIWVQRGAPVIQNNRVQNNRINDDGANGGGIELEETQATLVGNIISNNVISSTSGYGGGIDANGGGPVTITNNSILTNTAAISGTASTASYGGGISLRSGVTASVDNNLISNNLANGAYSFNVLGGGEYGYGGGIYINNSQSFTLSGNTILSNTASYKYYLYPSGGGLQIESSTGIMSNNIITGNHANGNVLFGQGGGLAVYSSTLTIQGGQISNNKTAINCEGYGGGLYAQNSSITIDAVRFDINCAANTSFYGLGGGLDFLDSPYTITNAIISNNIAYNNDTSVGGLSARGASPGWLINNTFVNNRAQGVRTGAALTATNNIFQYAGVLTTTGISLSASVPVSVTYNDFYGYVNEIKGFSFDLSNIVINPSLDSAYHLNFGSPAIDAGTHTNAPTHDYDREPRAMIGPSGLFKIDIGADERTGAAQTNRPLATLPADFTLIGPGNPQENPGSTGSNDWIGYAAWGGDISGDNRADLIIGAPNISEDFDNGPNDTGRVFALYNNGSRRLGVMDLYTTTANVQVRSGLNQQHIAQSFATADLNGDGSRDLFIGASGAANFGITGTVFVFQGGAGLSGTKTLSPSMQATWRFRSGENTGTFGNKNSLATGKLSSDGIDDLVVAESGATGPGGHTQAGAIFIFFGSASPLTLWDVSVLSASVTIFGPATNSQLARVAVGDVNGDGKPDLIVRSATNAYVFYGPLAAGVIDLATTPADVTITGLNGDWLAAGDVDGDGKADIILGRSAEVDVVRGGTLGATQTIGAAAWARFTGIAPTTLYSFDWNGDVKAEVLIGDTFSNRAFVIFGGASLANPVNIFDAASWIISGEKTGDQFGFSFGGADLDADGGLDLIIGSRTHTVANHPLHFDDAGAVYVLYGGPGIGLNQRIYLPVILR